MRKAAVVLAAVVLIGGLAVPAVAQDDEVRLDLDFRSESLNQVLQMFRRGYGLEYTLGEGVDPDTQITTHLRGVTLDQALQSILEPNGLLAVEQNGRYVIRERPEAQEREVQDRTVDPAFAQQGRTPPAPTRTVRDYEPRRGAADEDDEEERETVMEIIWPMYLGADGAAMIFGGGIIEAGGAYGAGGGYGGSSGGYGGSSNIGGRSGGIGSSRGTSNFGSSGGTSNFGSSRGTSNFGSSRNTGSSNW
ncbi:MAG: STN domain-containing protein [Armatimonadota bacterium]